MIAATVRASLNADDEALAVQLLAGDSPAEADRLRAAARDRGADALWDDPRLWDLLRATRDLTQPSAALFVYVALRHTLRELGVDRRDLADYTASLMLAFGRAGRAWRVNEHDDTAYTYVVDLAGEAARADDERQFRVFAHLGNFALWLTGIFPDYIAARRARKGGPDLDYYEAAGRSGFQRAAGHRLAESYGLANVLGDAGALFTELRVALNRFSDRVMFPHAHSPDRLLRQVADEFRLLH